MLAGVERRRNPSPRRERLARWVRERFTRSRSPWRRSGSLPMRDRLRWRVAGMLNRSSGSCWPDLVSWAMATREEQRKPRTRHPLREVVGTSTCQLDALTTGVCYCGKFTASARTLADAEGGEA